MAVVSVRTKDEETKLFKSHASLHDISLSEAYKRALLEKIEDEFDAAEMVAAVQNFNKNSKTHSLDELRKHMIYKMEFSDETWEYPEL